MSNSKSIFTDFFGNKYYFIFSIIAAVPVFIAAATFAKNANVHEDEAVAFSTCVIFVLGIFSGRYLARIRTSRPKPVRNVSVTLMAIFIIACISWLFFYAEFPLNDRSSLSLLLFWLPFLALSIAIGMFIKVIRSFAERQLVQAQQSAAQSKSELSVLQSQLSPHFLFNTLNNMYGLSITNHEKIPPLLLKLSELLRYSVYQADEMFVPLKDEVDYIKNYIEFEKLRIGDKLELNSSIEQQQVKEIKIAPMLLIVFIENAFKHSKNTADEKIYIEIVLKTWENYILFNVKNSQARSLRRKNNVVDKNSGYGMANVQKRLELLYPNNHMLEIIDEEDFYKVTLQLKMK